MTTIRTFGENGTFSKSDWLSESRTHLRSSKMLRLVASEKLKESELLHEKYKGRRAPSREVIALVNDRHSANKTSFLLLGYAFELLLKSGVLAIYVGLPKSLFEKDIKGKYGHNLYLMAKDLSLDLSNDDKRLLSELKDYILFKARYPTFSNEVNSYCRDTNNATSKFNDNDIFTKYLNLYHKLEARIKEIDSTSEDPKISFTYHIDEDGYFIYRQGGTLQPMMIYKYSSKQVSSGKDQAYELKSLLDNVDHRVFNYYLNRDWECAKHLLHKVDEDKESLQKISVKKT